MKKLLLLVFSAILISFNSKADCPGLTTTFYMNPASCFGNCDGHGYASVAGGSGNYNYSFVSSGYSVLPNQVSDSVYNLCAGNYYLIVHDITNGCFDTSAFSITSPPSLATITNGTSTICPGGTANLVSTSTGGTPGYTYLWSPPSGLSNPNASSTLAYPTMTTTYTLIVTDANGCTATATSTVIVNSPAIISVNSPTICAGQAAVLTATGGTTYSWNTGATSNPYTVIPATTTTYTVTGTTAAGCVGTATATVTVAVGPSITLSPSPATCGACNGAIGTSAPGATTFSWTGPSGFTSTVMNPTGLCAGTYTLTATGSTGCSSTAVTTVGNSSPVVATIGSVTPTACGASNGSATVFATGGTTPYSYSWSHGATTATANGLAAGTYMVIVTDVNGCTFTANVTITTSSTLTGTVSSADTPCGACNGTANVSASGGTTPYTYLWTGPGTLTGQGTPALSALCAGTYTVVVTDSAGCTYSGSTMVNNINPVYVTGSATPSTCGACNGTVTIVHTGGVGPYLFDLNNGSPTQTNGNFSGVCAGTYVGTVTDANGCSAIYTFFVPTTNASSFSATGTVQNETGYGMLNGAIDLTVSGSAPPYTFLWSNGATTEDIASLAAGMYNVTITDNNGDCGVYYYNLSTTPSYGYITGYAYNDNNANCVYDAGDAPLYGYYISVTNGTSTYWGYTNTAGYYSIWVPTGTFTVTPYNTTNLEAACTNTYSVNVTSGSTNANNNFSYIIPPVYDVCVYTWTNGIVPGFNGYYNINLFNYGNMPATGVLYFVLPGILDYVSSSPAASSISGDTIFWNYTNIPAYSNQYYTVVFNTPASAPLGAATVAYVNASVTNGTDINPACNSYVYTRIITGSFDPNDKTVSPSGSGANGDIPLTEDEFTYLIRFQNTGSGPAVNIKVTDTLSSMLDPMSFQMLDASHPYVVEILPGNVLHWKFDNIMLPDSTSDEAGSHGHVQFRINKLNAPVAGQVIENKAYIYFDFNVPVITNTAINTYNLAAAVEEQANENGTVAVYPNPFTEQTTFMIRSDKYNETYSFEMTDVLGKTVSKIKTNEKQFSVSRDGLQNGMYFYTITDNNGLVGTGKVIIK
jgi:uncharacterized repeat protein (TIGR01451 family)